VEWITKIFANNRRALHSRGFFYVIHLGIRDSLPLRI
jgi:hypothetical protein